MIGRSRGGEERKANRNESTEVTPLEDHDIQEPSIRVLLTALVQFSVLSTRQNIIKNAIEVVKIQIHSNCILRTESIL